MQVCTLAYGILNLSVNFFDRGMIDKRAYCSRGFQPVTCPKFLNSNLKCVEETIENLPLDKNSVGTDTRLSRVQELNQGNTLSGVYWISIIEDDKRRMPSQFHRHALKLRRCRLGQ